MGVDWPPTPDTGRTTGLCDLNGSSSRHGILCLSERRPGHIVKRGQSPCVTRVVVHPCGNLELGWEKIPQLI